MLDGYFDGLRAPIDLWGRKTRISTPLSKICFIVLFKYILAENITSVNENVA